MRCSSIGAEFSLATSTATVLADLLYVDDGRIRLWINRGGNRWSDDVVIDGTPRVSDMDAVRLADMLGTGGERGIVDQRCGRDRPRSLLLSGSHRRPQAVPAQWNGQPWACHGCPW